VESNEPRPISYNVYLNDNRTRMTVVQVHPDSASMEFHMKVASTVFAKFAGVIRLSAMDVYGKPSDDLLEQMQDKLRMLGNATVTVHDLHAGFDRFGLHWRSSSTNAPEPTARRGRPTSGSGVCADDLNRWHHVPPVGHTVSGMGETEDVERAIDELFVAPPEGFTESRNALAKRLKEDGDAEAARRVGALRKPVRSAWAVNRLVHEDRSAVEELLQVGQQLRQAQRRALSGGDADQLRQRSEERRKLVTALTRRAARALGQDPTPALIEEIAATFESASAVEDAAREVLEGRLSKPSVRPAGFGDVVGLKVVPGRGPKESAGPPADDGAERASRDREVRAAERRERQLRERVERLRAEVAGMEERLSERREKLRAAEAEARGAAVDLKRLRN
jgi:hypothetical protein